jgi:hypothetical protein
MSWDALLLLRVLNCSSNPLLAPLLIIAIHSIGVNCTLRSITHCPLHCFERSSCAFRRLPLRGGQLLTALRLMPRGSGARLALAAVHMALGILDNEGPAGRQADKDTLLGRRLLNALLPLRPLLTCAAR